MTVAAEKLLSRAPRTGVTSVVYLLGAGHSGSTLLATLLGSHPRICTIGEVKAPAIHDVSSYRCSCGRIIGHCGFWRALSELVGRHGVTLDVSNGTTDIRRAESAYVRRLSRPLHRGPLLERVRDLGLAMAPAWREHRRRFDVLSAAIASSVCQLTDTDVFVDSSKTGVQLKYLLRSPKLHVKVIRLVRDGRGVSNSYRKAENLSMSEAAYVWRRSNEEAAAIVKQLDPNRWLDIRYENLCRDVTGTMRSIFEFIGVEPVAAVSYTTREQHVLGNDKMRMNIGEIHLDEKWRKTLSDDDVRTFERVAGSLNRQLGYV
jgi:hypothetical protein